MKDNDLLITELYRDPNSDIITAISVYLTPKTSMFFDYQCISQFRFTGGKFIIIPYASYFRSVWQLD